MMTTPEAESPGTPEWEELGVPEDTEAEPEDAGEDYGSGE